MGKIAILPIILIIAKQHNNCQLSIYEVRRVLGFPWDDRFLLSPVGGCFFIWRNMENGIDF